MDQITDQDPRAEIRALEELIETLSERIERCRKLAMAARGLLIASALLTIAALCGMLRFDAVLLVAVISGALGGIVLLGSNRSTTAEAEARRVEAEARRAQLIGSIPLRVVH